MKLRRAFAVTVLAAMTVAASPASATGFEYTVRVGGSIADVPYVMTASSTGTIGLSLQRPGLSPLNMSCASANVAGTGSAVNGGHSGGPAPTDIADVAGISFGGCPGVGGTATVVTTTPMQLHGLAPATAGATDVVPVHLENFSITVSTVPCTFSVTGTARGAFNEATQQLTITETGYTGSLSYALIAGCLGAVPASGNANLVFTMNISTAGGPVNLMP